MRHRNLIVAQYDDAIRKLQYATRATQLSPRMLPVIIDTPDHDARFEVLGPIRVRRRYPPQIEHLANAQAGTPPQGMSVDDVGPHRDLGADFVVHGLHT